MSHTSRRRSLSVALACLAAAGVVGAAATAGNATGDAQRQRATTATPWIAYQREGSVWLVHPDGTDNHLLIQTMSGDQQRPDWSPDGKRLAFDVDFASIWTVDVDGRNADRIVSCATPCQFVEHAAWSPDGKKIAFARGDLTASGDATATTRILILDIASRAVRTVFTSRRGTDFLLAPRWSPDGSQLVFEMTRFANALTSTTEVTGSRIGTVRADGTGSVRYLAKFSDLAASPDWNRKRNLIVYQAGTRGIPDHPGDPANLFTVRPDGSRKRALTDFRPPAKRAVQPTWTPDGSRIIFTYVRGGGFGRPAAAFMGADGKRLVVPRPGTPIQTHARLQP